MAPPPDLDIAYVATLARLELSPEEMSLFQKQLSSVLEHAKSLADIDVAHLESAAHAIPVFNVFRPDEPCDWFTAAEALQNAPRQANDLFIVPKVVE